MSTLEFKKIKMLSANLGDRSDYPILFKEAMFEKGGTLAESEGLFLNYGKMMHTLPYSAIENYDHAENLLDYDAAILENDYIRAVFIPALGGRLWSIYDKEHERDLVINNPVFRPCNLAIANAWFSGGVEWNCGVRGHHALTCDKIYASRYTMQDGTPALRMYAFERIRAVTYQMDFFLPDESRFLYARMRLVNESDEVTPIYWWSTIAVEQKEGARVIVPATETYVNHGSDPVYVHDIPMFDGVDTSYPTNHTEATDHFYKIPAEERKFEAYLEADGKGIVHASTSRLKGRKMFVWGTSIGGESWQKQLTNEEGWKQPYLEIQAGLAYTQNESLPFPPHTAWEWLEAYCPAQLDPKDVHGEYQAARKAVTEWLDGVLPEETLDAMLADTHKDATSPAEVLFKGHAWGTLDNELRTMQGRKPIAPYLDFGELDAEQQVWHDFLVNGRLAEPDPTEKPASYMVQQEWFELLKKSVKGADRYNWYAWYNLGLCWYARDEYDLAKEMFEKSLALKSSTWAYHGLASAELALGRREEGMLLMTKALAMNPENTGLAKETLRLGCGFKQYSLVCRVYENLSEELQAVPIIRAFYAIALGYDGQSEKGMQMLDEISRIVVPDMREGDDSITSAYIYCAKAVAAKEGRELDDEDVQVPEGIDFRMFHVTKK